MPTTPTPDERGDAGESFLGRRSWGLAHYLWIALAVTLALGFIPRGARKALESNSNNAEDWLPASYAESTDLLWFRDHFAGEAFVLISWEGCTLGEPDKLLELQEKLGAVEDEEGWKWYPRIRSGPGTIDSLVDGPAGVSRSAAIERLEGALVGPPKIGPDGESLGDASRTTCLLAYLNEKLTNNNLEMRRAVERVRDIAVNEVGVPADAIHLGGPPVDNITIDIEGERTLIRLAGLSGIVGFSLAYLCFRSRKLTAMVFWTAGASAGMSLALVYWFGGFEKLLLGLDQPRLGRADAILMSMPAVVYVLALSGAIHLVNYYRDERLAHGAWGAAERAAKVAWGPCLLAAFTTAVGLGSLGSSDILPIQKFGVFSAIGVMVAVGMLFCIMPVFLYRFPPDKRVVEERAERRKRSRGHEWFTPLARFTTTRHALTLTLCLTAMALIGYGVTRTTTSVQLLGLLDDECRLIKDYEWLEAHLGNLVPMEVIVALEEDRLRSPDEPAVDPDADDPRYRMTMYERIELTKRLQAEVESLEEISRALSAGTFAGEPQDSGGSAAMRRGFEYTMSEKLEDSREELREYLRPEVIDGEPTGRELWRVSARVTALGEVDYGRFVQNLRSKVEPVLRAYALRDALVGVLAGDGVPLRGARVCLLTESNDPDNPRLPRPGTPEARLVELLRDSAGARLSVYPVDRHLDADEATREQRLEQLAAYDAVVTLGEAIAPKLGGGLEVDVLAPPPLAPDRLPATEAVATYTGVVPLVYKTQRELLTSLRESIIWATGLIACVMVFVLRSPAAGVVSMLPNVFPIVMVFGALGWLGIPVDIGIMMTASVALGVAVDDTLHFVTWFGRGVRQEGLDRQSAVLLAYDRCATAMTQTTLIGGLGLAVFAVSTFTPTQQFGTLMITILGVALVGDLVLLPALLCGPFGRFFAPGAPARPTEPTPQSEAHFGEPADRPADEPAVLACASTDDAPTGPTETAEPTDPNASGEEQLSPANAALRARLQKFRRQASG